MKKILAIAIVAMMTVALCLSASALHHTSADQVMAESDGHDLALVGNNDKENTDLGAITEENIIVWGWHSTESEGIDCFGYRYGDVVITDSEKYIGNDAETIASQCGGTGESVRFRITVPVLKGSQEVVAVVKLKDGTVEDMWTIKYTAENGKTLADLTNQGSEQPSTEKGEDQWLCEADPTTATGWWFNPVGDPDDRYVQVNFTATSSFSGVKGYYYCSNPPANPELGLEYSVMTVELIKDGSVVATTELRGVGDDWVTLDFGKAFAAGDYSLKYTCKSGSGIENNCWCVIGSANGSDENVTVDNAGAGTNDNTLSHPALMLVGAAGSSSGETTPPATADAAVIAIAAVACVALAGVVIAKKIR